MTRQRTKEPVIEVEAQTTLQTEVDAAPFYVAPVETDWKSVQPERLPDAAMVHDGGTRPPIEGIYYNTAKPTLTVHGTGTLTACGNGVTPVEHAGSLLLGLALQGAAQLLDGAKCIAGWTTVAGSENTGGAHAVTSVESLDGTAYTAIGLALFYVTSLARFFVRPFTYASPAFSLLMALPAAPALDDVIYGGILTPYRRHWTAVQPSPPRIAALRHVSNDAEQNARVWGAFGTVKFPSVKPGATPRNEFAFQCAQGARNFVRIRVPADKNTPRTVAGGGLWLAKFGNTAGFEIPGRCAIEQLGGYAVTEQHGVGISDAIRTGDSGWQVKLTIPHDVTPASVTGGTMTSWRAALDSDTSVDQEWHLVRQDGGTPGAVQGYYLPRLQLTAVDDDELDGVEARTLTLKPSTVAPPVVPPIAYTPHLLVLQS